MKKSVQLIALVAVALLSSCSGGEKDKATAEKVDEKPRVKLASVTARPVDQIQEYTATVQAEVKNNIAPSSPVRIDQIFVEVGDRVSKGQKLVQMDAANLKQAKCRLDNQEIEFKRTDELYKVGGTSKSEWDAAKMALDVQKTTYKNLLENTALLSPINGVVTARNYDNGDMYSGGDPVLVVEQITPVKLIKVAIARFGIGNVNEYIRFSYCFNRDFTSSTIFSACRQLITYFSLLFILIKKA